MKYNFYKILFLTLLLLFPFKVNSEVLKKTEVYGNERIAVETIVVYGGIEKGKNYSQEDINNIIKNLYDTKFFSNISVDFSNGILKINVEENPIIESIIILGEPTKKFTKAILDALSLKEKSSYIKSDVKNDLEVIKYIYRTLGYYSPKVEARTQESKIGKNSINLIFDIDKGERQKISKIYFIGEKKIKTKRLRDVIASEEAKFWKFISRNVYLNEERIELDKRLLKNYYLSKGYYDVQILSSNVFVKEKEGVELTFSIDAGNRYRIKKISTNIDPVFDKTIFQPLALDFKKYAGGYYSPFKIQKILKNIDNLIDLNELQFVQHSVSETVDGNFIDVEFKIFEGRKVQIERVNIKGNTITNEAVIRAELELDEGDPYSKIKLQKTVANLKSRNIFKTVNQKVLDGSSKDLKVLEISVEEKPTGEIMAGAGTGTEGTTFSFALAENNYLGKGLRVDTTLDVSESTIRGGLDITDPNFNYSGNMVTGGIASQKTDSADSGYENTLNSVNVGTKFEQYDNIFFSPSLELSFDDLKVDASASDSLKKQAGSFADLTFGYGIEKDTRDRSFMPTDGSLIGFSQGIPLYADEQASFYNRLSINKYNSFSDDVIGAAKFYAASVIAIDQDVRISKRLHIPSKRLRGFERRKVGPLDGKDYVGGNYATALNLEAALPNLLPEGTQTDIAAFFDIGNLWHVDYDSTIDQSSEIRSSIGVATNMYTLIGPLNFVFAQKLSAADTDKTQTFKFEIGTSF